MMKTRFFTIMVAVLLVVAGCTAKQDVSEKSGIEISDAWVRVVGNMEAMGDMGPATAIFMNIHNYNDQTDLLLKAETDIAEMAQIHLSEVDANGVSSMHEVKEVLIPADGLAELKPGSYHIMLMGLKKVITEGEMITVTLTFQNAGAITIEAPVRKP